MAIQGRRRAAAPADGPRGREQRAFGLVTAELVRVRESGRADFVALAHALEANRRLWNLLSADCALEDNRLPNGLRAQIITLALWVSRHTSLVLREDADIAPLIDVNRSLMAGLAD